VSPGYISTFMYASKYGFLSLLDVNLAQLAKSVLFLVKKVCGSVRELTMLSFFAIRGDWGVSLLSGRESK